jgi:hypothetical protein
MDEIFDSAVRPAGDLAGVFEYDGETGYFYLYATGGGAGQRVLDSIHVLSGEPDFAKSDISICWDSEEQKVGLFIKGVLWAAFDCGRRTKYGGSYKPGGKPSLPSGADVGF